MKKILIIIFLSLGLILSVQAQEKKKKSLFESAKKKSPETTKVNADTTKKDGKKSLFDAAVDRKKKTASKVKGAEPIVGRVLSLNDLAIHKNGFVSTEKARKLFSKGQPLVFKAINGKIYIVYNTDGSYAGKKLAMLADHTKVGIVGKVKIVNGVRVLIASDFATGL